MPRVPLDQEFPGVPTVTATQPPATSDQTQITTLPNGLRVVSIESSSPISAIGAFVDSGSRYEDEKTAGISHFLELMAFKSTQNRSDFGLTRDMLKLGANISCASSRENMIYTADSLLEHSPKVIQTLADIVQNPAFIAEEVEYVKESHSVDYDLRYNAPDIRMIESIHEAAYHNNTLGRPMYAPKSQIKNFTPELLADWHRRFYTPSRTVLAAIGIGHQDLVRLAEESFKSLNADVTPFEKPKAQYTGGEVRIHEKGAEQTHFSLAFETASWKDTDLVPMCVLQSMLGGGGSFSVGGPGKGMYTRLYNNVLQKNDWVDAASSFNSIFSDSSLLGVYVTSRASKAAQLVDVLIREILRTTGPVDPVELTRAKNQLKSTVLMQLESRLFKLEDVGRQVLTYGRVVPSIEICSQIDRVTAEDVQRVAKKALSTVPSVAAFGDLTHVPRYETIQNALKQK